MAAVASPIPQKFHQNLPFQGVQKVAEHLLHASTFGPKICSPNHILSFGNLKNLTNLTGSTMSEGHMQKQIRFLKSAGKL